MPAVIVGHTVDHRVPALPTIFNSATKLMHFMSRTYAISASRARIASGIVVMLMRSSPHERKTCDSVFLQSLINHKNQTVRCRRREDGVRGEARSIDHDELCTIVNLLVGTLQPNVSLENQLENGI